MPSLPGTYMQHFGKIYVEVSANLFLLAAESDILRLGRW
jgi:hypothetical protein